MSKHSNIELKVKEGIPAEKVIRKFKRLCDLYGVTKEYRKRKEYQKPSIKKKEKLKASEKRRNKSTTKRSY